MGIWDKLTGRNAPEVTRKEPQVSTSSVPKVSRRSRTAGRNYAAAGSQAYYGNFNASSGSADYELSIALVPMRNKIRAMIRNSGTGKRYRQLLKDNVVGEAGFNLRVRVKQSVDAKKPDRSLNIRVEKAWNTFCEAPTVDGVMDMVELEKQMVATWASDGEVIWEIVRGPQYVDGFAINPIEADLLDESLNMVHPTTGNLIKMGVEVDVNGRPVAYHFLTYHPGDMSWAIPRANKRHRRVLADRVIHMFERLRPGQTRGEPPASSVVNMVKMLDGYREAEVTGRRVKSSTMGLIIDTPESEAGGSKLDGMADRVTEDHSEFEMDMEPGTFKKLPRGLDFKAFDPGGAQTDYAQFEGQVKTDASQGVSISPVALGYETAKLSYSTHRGIIADDREMYKGLQSFFIRMGMRKLFLIWIKMHTSRNTTSEIPPSRVMAIIGVFKFQPRGWDYIDPSKDVKAENEQLKARTTSLSRVVAKRGVALEDLLDEIAEDEAMLREYGLTQSFEGDTNAQTTSSDDGDGDD